MKKSNYLFREIKHPKDVNDYYHVFNQSNILNVIYWHEFLKMAAKIKGDIVECGVGRGKSIITLSILDNYMELIYSNYPKRRIFCLDSFNGFPHPTIEDTSERKATKGEWRMSPNNQFKYTITNIRKVIQKASVCNKSKSKIKLIKGYFNNTTKKLKVKNIAILHLDGDLYQSVKDPLENLAPMITKGGIIVIDDYIIKQKKDLWPGSRKAVTEFLKKNKNFEIKESIKGSPYLIKN
tara:strand:- start:242 stop:952 length:711 start_codon:yes stop_codon:yes gene_type:complete